MRDSGKMSVELGAAQEARSAASVAEEVEALVALALANGCTSDAKAEIEAAVRRARVKARIVGSARPEHLASALKEVAEAVAELPRATRANAAEMAEVTEVVRACPRECGDSPPAPRAPRDAAALAASAMAPLRALAAQVAADAPASAAADAAAAALPRAPALQMRAACAVDFDECHSPRARAGSPRAPGAPGAPGRLRCKPIVLGDALAYALGPSGAPRGGRLEPADVMCDQFQPMSPSLSAARRARLSADFGAGERFFAGGRRASADGGGGLGAPAAPAGEREEELAAEKLARLAV